MSVFNGGVPIPPVVVAVIMMYTAKMTICIVMYVSTSALTCSTNPF